MGKDSTDGDAKNLIGQTVDSQIPNTMTCSRSKREYFNKAKMHNHPLGFSSVANRSLGILILQYNYLRFFNW